MKINEVLSKIHAPKGVTSILAGVMSGDFDPIRHQDATGKSLIQAKAILEEVKKAQVNCKSDWAYWGYEGDRAYWQAVVYILEAAELTDELPDIDAPNTNTVVMDAAYNVEQYGKKILEMVKNEKPQSEDGV